MTQTVLLTLGRLPKALDLARSFSRAGHRVIVAEPFRYHLTGASRHVARSIVVTAPAVSAEAYLQQLLDVIRAERVDLVVPVSEEILHVSRLAPRLPASVRMFALPHQTLLELHDKHRFIQLCGRFGLTAPPTFALGDPRAAELAASGATVIKPVYSCSGRGLRYLSRGATLPAADPAGSGPGSIVQARVDGPVLSSFSIAHAGRTLGTFVYRGVVMSGSVAVCFERLPSHPAIEAWVRQFVERSAFDGFISFDFIVDRDARPWAIECNPRATSGLHFVHGEDLAAAVLQPDAVTALRPCDPGLRQQFYPCLTETQRSLLHDRSRVRRNLRALWQARDVTWDRSDPWPFLSMPATSLPIIRESIRRGCTFGEVATLDVGWYADV